MFTINRAVVFAILMQTGEGVISKAPDYIAEKLEAVGLGAHPERLLDMENGALYNKWLRTWGRQEEKLQSDGSPESQQPFMGDDH